MHVRAAVPSQDNPAVDDFACLSSRREPSTKLDVSPSWAIWYVLVNVEEHLGITLTLEADFDVSKALSSRHTSPTSFDTLWMAFSSPG
jgi:hypothetical protein